MFRRMQVLPECLIALGIISALVGWRLGREKPADSSVRPVPLLNDSGRSVDCGPSALYIVGKLSGHARPLEELREMTKTTVVGTDMLYLRDAAIEIGFTVEAVLCSFERLSGHLATPGSFAILYSSKGHFAAVVRQSGPLQVRMVDAVIGVQDLTDLELREGFGWDGAVLLLSAKT